MGANPRHGCVESRETPSFEFSGLVGVSHPRRWRLVGYERMMEGEEPRSKPVPAQPRCWCRSGGCITSSQKKPSPRGGPRPKLAYLLISSHFPCFATTRSAILSYVACGMTFFDTS